MKPDIHAVLTQTAQSMLQEFAPRAAVPYLAAQIGMSAFVMSMVAEDLDRAAARRVEENQAIRALFARAAGLALEAGLAARLASLAGGDDGDLRLSALEAGNMALRAGLIDLQAAVETRADVAATAINDAIWTELSASTERRRLASANF